MNIIKFTKYIFFTFFLYISLSLDAQNRPHIVFNESNGLLSNHIYGVAQDNRGYIWFTSNVGLARFDGKEFVNYSVLDGLPNNFNWRLFHDSHDRIWLFNNSTPFTYIKNDSVYRIGDKIDDFHLQSIVEDDDGNIHINQTGRERDRYLITKNNEVVKKDRNQFIGNWKTNSIYLENQELIIQNKQNKIIYRSDTTKAQSFHFKLLGDFIYFVYPKKFSIFNLITKSYKVLYVEKTTNQFITINIIRNKIIVGKKKGFYIGEKEQFKLVDSTLFLSHVLIDKNNNEWLPTLGDGVYFYPSLNQKVINYPDNRMRNIYFNETNYSLYCANSSSKFYEINNNKKKSLLSLPEINVITNIVSLKDYNIYFGARTTYVSDHIDLSKNYEFVTIESDTIFKIQKNFKYSTGGSRAYSVENNTILLANQLGLSVIEIRNDTFSYKSLIADRVLACCLHGNTKLYGNESGLYSVVDTTLTPVFHEQFNNSTVRSIIYAPMEKAYFIGTEQGFLFKVSESLESIYKYKIQFNQIRDLSIKNRNTILISTSNQLIEYNLKLNQIDKKIGKAEGLKSNYVIKTIYIDSTYYIATNAGLTILSDNDISKQNKKHYPCYLKSIQIGNINTELNDTINLGLNNNYLKIEFTNLTYWSNQEVQFKYRLKELNDEWTTTSSSQVEFAEFPYGEYTFQLKTIDEKNIDRPELLELIIIRPKPFWLTLWFKTLIVLLSFVLLALIINNYYRKKIKTKTSEQEKQLLKHKTALAEYKALRLQMNPHFLFNSLNAVQNSILDNDVEQANAYLNDFATLMRQILQFSTKESIKLSEEIKLSKDYLNIEKNRYKNTIIFELNIGDEIDMDSILVPPMIFQPILENAIWHGIVPLNKNGNIVLTITEKGEFIKVIISDNGVGYVQSLSKPKSVKKRDSIAIQNTCDRLKLFNKSAQKKDKYITIANNTEQGTEVIMYIYKKHMNDL